jgi:dipeptidyl aminopeptidase/acylaminoacyl peptidase
MGVTDHERPDLSREPHESHGYSARESVLHVLAEMFEWFDTYVKDRK